VKQLRIVGEAKVTFYKQINANESELSALKNDIDLQKLLIDKGDITDIVEITTISSSNITDV